MAGNPVARPSNNNEKKIIMNIKSMPAGFGKIQRHDGIFQEQVHDAYKAKGKLPEPVVCSQCHAVFEKGRWCWGNVPAKALRAICPACHRQHDHYPAGFVTLEGSFFTAHNSEIMRLIYNHALRERIEHPLKRIMSVEVKDDSVLVTTTDIHLARGIGEALHRAYRGELEFHYNPEENLLRVHWAH
jgi:hypothetical protein